MKLLVTGGAGFIGSAVIRHIINSTTDEVVNLDKLTYAGNLQSWRSQDLITFVKDRPGHDKRYAIGASKIQKELGWAPEETFETGMRTTVQWYLNNLDWCQRVQNDTHTRNPKWDSNKPDPATSNTPYWIFNIGNNNPIKLGAYIEANEDALGKKAIKDLLPLQLGDVSDTTADLTELENAVRYKTATPVKKDVAQFATCCRDFYGA